MEQLGIASVKRGEGFCYFDCNISHFGLFCLIKLSKGARCNQATTKCSSILSLRRFLARRGTVNVMRSDNGTNFVEASTELKKSIKALDQASISKHLVAKIEIGNLIHQ